MPFPVSSKRLLALSWHVALLLAVAIPCLASYRAQGGPAPVLAMAGWCFSVPAHPWPHPVWFQWWTGTATANGQGRTSPCEARAPGWKRNRDWQNISMSGFAGTDPFGITRAGPGGGHHAGTQALSLTRRVGRSPPCQAGGCPLLRRGMCQLHSETRCCQRTQPPQKALNGRERGCLGPRPQRWPLLAAARLGRGICIGIVVSDVSQELATTCRHGARGPRP